MTLSYKKAMASKARISQSQVFEVECQGRNQGLSQVHVAEHRNTSVVKGQGLVWTPGLSSTLRARAVLGQDPFQTVEAVVELVVGDDEG